MTDPTAPELPVDAEAPAAVEGEATPAETKSGSGRPRPQATIDQDAKALDAIRAAGETGLTKDELATAIEVPPNRAYLSLWRLKRDDLIHKVHSGGSARWVAGTAQDAPVTSESVPSDGVSADEAPAVPTEETVAL